MRRRRKDTPPPWQVHQAAAAGSAYRGPDDSGLVTERVAGRDYNPDGTVAREWAGCRITSPARPSELLPSPQPSPTQGGWRKFGRVIWDFVCMVPTALLFAGVIWLGAHVTGLLGAVLAGLLCTLWMAWLAAER